ncbi:MAG: hypothetical protein NWE90_02605, partial [Candidatus Bathyarchaeota archaeon]|nr:hypothetical protein [Candidatus Bathyarchaeota archaeon]
TGKSDLAMLICERAMKQNTIIVVFDPSQDWIRRSSIKRYLKVESYTNLEIPSESLVYDLSLLSPIESQKVVERFSKRLFNYQAKIPEDKRRQYLVILEESHTYFYQGSMQSKRMQNSVKMLSVGRNVDIAVLLISQFASMLDKFAIKHSISQVWFGYTREPNDLKYLRLILGDNAEQLKKLEDGELLYLTRNGISKIAIEPFSSTIARTQIKIPEPKLIQIPEKSKTETNDFQTMAYLIVWTLFSIVALSILR